MLLVAGLLLGSTDSGRAASAPGAELWSHFLSHQPRSGREIDHSAWDVWLDRYVSQGRGDVVLVAYAKVRRSDRYLLDSYIHDLEGIRITRYSRAEQLAYWINLYNALSVKQVLELLPIESLRDLLDGSAAPRGGPWNEKLVTIEGEGVSLNDIENRSLRPIWHDPRVLYALNRAAVGAPSLLTKAYTAHNLDTLLDQVARTYVNSRRGLSVSGGRLTVSSLYTWYKDDFGGDDRAVIEHLMVYAEPELREQLAAVSEISGEQYDWRLNAASVAVPEASVEAVKEEVLPGDSRR